MKLIITGLAFALAAATPAAAQAPERPDTLQLEHYMDWETAGAPQISPDGDTIIYTRRRVDALADRIESQLWIMDANGERHRFLTEGGGARWAPDGSRIAFLRDTGAGTQIFTRWMDAEGAESQITHTQRRIKNFDWSPGAEAIAFLAEIPMDPAIEISLPSRPEGATWTENPMVTDRVNYRIDRQGLKTGFDHLFVVPADGGTERQLTGGEWDARATFSGIPGGSWDWTPDGAAIVFDGDMEPDNTKPSYVSGIHRVEVATGELTTLLDNGGNWSNPVVSPNGRLIAFVGHEPDPANHPGDDLMLMDIDGSNVRVIRDELPDSPGGLDWAENSRSLFYSMNFEGETQLYSLNLNGNETALTEGMHRFSLASMSDDGAAAGTISSPTDTGNVALYTRRGGLRVLTDLNADILEGVTLGRVEELWYESFDGERIQGWIVYPPDFDPSQRYPLVLDIHGGPHAMYGVNFSFAFQKWASAGYVVLFTNPRGSTGYSTEFANAIDNQYPGPVDYGDLMAGVDTVLERGFIDEDNLFVTGCSGGGVLTTWIVTQTDRFAAAAALCPVTNWISFTGQADISAWSFERFRPNYWEEPSRWLEHSPIMHAHRVTTPTLLMTGAKDLRTPLAQAEEFYANLVRRGVPSVLISMVGEYHGTSSIPSNLMRTHLYLDAWFKEHGTFDDESDAAVSED